MIVTRSRKAVVAWIACFAVLLATLSPTIALALQREAPADWMEVCTAMGTKLVAADGTVGDSTPALPGKHLLQHCAYCSLHVTALGMPPMPLSVPALTPFGDAVPELLLVAPRTLFAWATAQPRAPPQVS
ncbi:DUF2946 domain-containing protein [soil metagenome]